MIAFNLSVDFEMGWGDLERLAVDDVFYRRVIEGNGHVAEVIQLFGRLGMQSTWGVVGACCYGDIDELHQSAPRSFHAVGDQLNSLVARRADYSRALFCRGTVEAIARAAAHRAREPWIFAPCGAGEFLGHIAGGCGCKRESVGTVFQKNHSIIHCSEEFLLAGRGVFKNANQVRATCPEDIGSEL